MAVIGAIKAVGDTAEAVIEASADVLKATIEGVADVTGAVIENTKKVTSALEMVSAAPFPSLKVTVPDVRSTDAMNAER